MSNMTWIRKRRLRRAPRAGNVPAIDEFGGGGGRFKSRREYFLLPRDRTRMAPAIGDPGVSRADPDGGAAQRPDFA